jgi:uncharacterized protein (DUF2062 family)
MANYWHSVKTAFRQELSWSKIVYSSAWGVWIAFCPFVGLHTALCFMVSWLLSLNVAILLGLSLCINNPWTMVPIYYFDYKVGHLLYDYFVGYSPKNPFWLESVVIYLQRYVHVPAFSFWAFIVGGTVTATIAAVFTWGIMRQYVLMYQTKWVRK